MDPQRIPPFLEHQSPPPPPPPPSSSSGASFIVLVLSILGILATSILLLGYYLFLNKRCFNWRRSDTTSRLSPHHHNGRSAVYSTTAAGRGLDESLIRAIPTLRYRKGGGGAEEVRSFHECAVCLNEFQEEERIRLLPNCFHVFHIDCIDTWLQSNANCPLCRSAITTCPILTHQLLGPTTTRNPQNPRRNESIVIGVAGGGSHEHHYHQHSPQGRQEGHELNSKGRKVHGLSKGDECIDVRSKEEEFWTQPIRRSFSMDSSSDRQLYLAVQQIIQKNPLGQEAGIEEGGSSSTKRVRRHFFSFSQHWNPRSAVLLI